MPWAGLAPGSPRRSVLTASPEKNTTKPSQMLRMQTLEVKAARPRLLPVRSGAAGARCRRGTRAELPALRRAPERGSFGVFHVSVIYPFYYFFPPLSLSVLNFTSSSLFSLHTPLFQLGCFIPTSKEQRSLYYYYYYSFLSLFLFFPFPFY